MAGIRELRGEEKYQLWLKRHVPVERQRKWRLINEANPIRALDEHERGPLPQTFSLAEMYWHPLACECGSCAGVVAQAVKQFRMSQRPIPPAVKSVVSRLPELPDQIVPHLRDVAEEALSKLGSQASSQTELE